MSVWSNGSTWLTKGARLNASIPVMHVQCEGDSWYAACVLADGSHYTAVSDTRIGLDARIRESARAEGWTGWATISSGAVHQ